MNETHTPGPWHSRRYETEEVAYVHGPDHKQIAICQYGPAEENGRLIAAAPDLLAALRAVEASLLPYRGADYSSERTYLVGREVIRAARAAIAAAEGREVTR